MIIYWNIKSSGIPGSTALMPCFSFVFMEVQTLFLKQSVLVSLFSRYVTFVFSVLLATVFLLYVPVLLMQINLLGYF